MLTQPGFCHACNCAACVPARSEWEAEADALLQEALAEEREQRLYEEELRREEEERLLENYWDALARDERLADEALAARLGITD